MVAKVLLFKYVPEGSDILGAVKQYKRELCGHYRMCRLEWEFILKANIILCFLHKYHFITLPYINQYI